MSKREIWLGKLVDVKTNDFGSNSSYCDKCCFNGACTGVECTSNQRDDRQEVYFTLAPIDDTIKPDPEHNAETSKEWMAVAAHNHRNTQYYQGVLDKIGDMLGIVAYTSDDGSIQDTVLRAKIPELVAKLVYDNVRLQSRVNQLEILDL